MAFAMLQTASYSNVHDLASALPPKPKSQAFEDAHQALLNALHHVRDSDSDLARAMANTRLALDAIRDMRQCLS